MARLQARPIPRVKGKWPGNLDILLQLVYSEGSDYPTEILGRWADEYGPTFDMNMLWSHQIFSGEELSCLFCDLSR